MHTTIYYLHPPDIVKLEVKWSHLCQGVLKWSWGEVGFMHVFTGWKHELLNWAKHSKDSVGTSATCYSNRLLLSDSFSNQLCLAKISFLLPTPIRILCKQHVQAFPFVLKKKQNPDFCSQVGHSLGCHLNLCSLNCNSETLNECFCFISVLPLFLVDNTIRKTLRV